MITPLQGIGEGVEVHAMDKEKILESVEDLRVRDLVRQHLKDYGEHRGSFFPGCRHQYSWLVQKTLGKNLPRITAFTERTGKKLALIRPVLPASNLFGSSDLFTGKLPSEHGIVGNGWYDRTLNEHHFWKQSNALVSGEKVWEKIKAKRPDFKTAKLFWWYNMYSSADFSITPRPLYGSDGNKVFDVHSQPMNLRREEGRRNWVNFLPRFLGPDGRDRFLQMDCDSARWIEERCRPDLLLIYLPHLDYDLQRYGPKI